MGTKKLSAFSLARLRREPRLTLLGEAIWKDGDGLGEGVGGFRIPFLQTGRASDKQILHELRCW
jgi:hypothetical protein